MTTGESFGEKMERQGFNVLYPDSCGYIRIMRSLKYDHGTVLEVFYMPGGSSVSGGQEHPVPLTWGFSTAVVVQ